MQVDDLMEVMSLIAKLNRTVDGQQQVISKYVELYGPLPEDAKTGQEKAKMNGQQEPVPQP